MSLSETSPRDLEKIVAQRKSAERLLRILLPTRISDEHGSLPCAHEWVKSGNGLVIISNHFSLRDGPQVFSAIPAKDDIMRQRTWTSPVAQHQYPITRFIDMVLHTHLQIRPVVTPDAHRKHPEMRLGQGLREYVLTATETLKSGGILVLFPQAERQPTLGTVDESATSMSLLINRTTKTDVDNYFVLPIGFGISGVEDYSQVRGANIGKTYDVSIGRLWAKNEMVSDAARSGISLDAWAFGQLRQLVPNAYK
jgi:hypothetical protein